MSSASATFSLAAYAGVRVLVLGAAGFIGRWVARALCQQGAATALAVRGLPAAERVFARFGITGQVIVTDLADPDNARRLIQTLRPAVIFNLAGYGVDRAERNVQTAYLLNAALVEAICEAIARSEDTTWSGQQIVHVGSALEYGAIGGDLSESSAPQPTTLYGESKLAGTLALASCCQAHETRGLTARLFSVYGPGEHYGRLLPSLMEAASTGNTVELTEGLQKRDFTWVRDVAEGLLRLGLATARPGEIVNLATGQLTTVCGFVETAAAILGVPHDRLLFGLLPTRMEEMAHSRVAVERLRQLTGWLPPTGIAEGIRQTVAFECSR